MNVNEKISLLLRHADRDDIPKGSFGNEILLNKKGNQNSTQNGTTIFITHDMLIAFYHFSINKKVYTKDNWINYLTGLTFRNNELARN
jgi:hypothetical protein